MENFERRGEENFERQGRNFLGKSESFFSGTGKGELIMAMQK